MRLRPHLLVFVSVVLALASQARAQSGPTTATLSGIVSDETLGALPGATVTATNLATSFGRSSVSDPDGRFTMAALPPGRYAVRAELTGFAPRALPDVTLTLGASVDVDLVLRVATRQDVVVSAEATRVDTDRTSLSHAISRRQIDELPINGRNFISFSLITPTATADRAPQQGASASSGLTFAGQHARSNNVTVDGLDNNDSNVGSVRATFSQEAVQEFQVLAHSYAAEFGRASGGVVNIVTRSGTNTPAGVGFGFLRDTALNAKDHFEQFNPAGQAIDVAKAPYSQHQFGMAFGGPIRRDRTFFFASVERLAIQANNFVTIDDRGPVTLFGQTIGTPADIIRRAGFQLETGHVPYAVRSNAVLLKLDHQIAPGQTIALRYNYAGMLNENIEPFGGLVARSGGGALDSIDHAVGAAYVGVRGRMVNELRIQAALRDQVVYSLDPTCNDRCDREDEGGPTIEISGIATLGRHRYTPSLHAGISAEILDTATFVAGRHLVKAGIDVNTVDHNKGTIPVYFGGRFIFVALPAIPGVLPAPVSAIQAFALGLPGAYVVGYGTSGARYRTSDLSLFVQDDWRVRPHVTLKIGLRYQTQFWPDYQFNSPGLGPYRLPNDRNDLAPRVALAWTPGDDRKTSLHGAYGIFYDNQITSDVGLARVINGAADGLRTRVVSFPASIGAWGAPGRRLPEPPAGTFTSLVLGLDPQAKTPYAHHASLGIDRTLTGGLRASADVVFARGFNGIATIDYNPTLPALGAGRRPLDVNGVAGTSSNALQYTTIARTWYQGVVLALERPLAGRWQMLASYTFSNAEDTAADFQSEFVPESNGFGRNPADPLGLPLGFDPLAERGPALHDQRHRFVMSGLWMAPASIQLSAIVTAASGAPFNILAGADLNGDGDAGNFPTDRARRNVADPSSHVGRNSGRLPAEASVDLRVSRRFALGGSRSVEVLLEAFNLFNRTNIVEVNRVFGLGAYPSNPLPAFGQPVRAGSARQVQIGARVRF